MRGERSGSRPWRWLLEHHLHAAALDASHEVPAKQRSPEELHRSLIGVEDGLRRLAPWLAELEVGDAVDQGEEAQVGIEEFALHALKPREPAARLPARQGMLQGQASQHQDAEDGECEEPDAADSAKRKGRVRATDALCHVPQLKDAGSGRAVAFEGVCLQRPPCSRFSSAGGLLVPSVSAPKTQRRGRRRRALLACGAFLAAALTPSLARA